MSARLIHHQLFPLPDSVRHLPNPRLHFPSHLRTQISCLSNNDDKKKPSKRPRKKTTMGDAELALELAVEVEKMKIRSEERESAMRLSREMLFDELCEYLKMKSDREEVKRRWRRMPEEEQRGLVSAFVSDWGVDFHPLSRKGVKELLDEFVGVDGDRGFGTGGSNLDSVAALGFSGLKRLIGFVSR